MARERIKAFIRVFLVRITSTEKINSLVKIFKTFFPSDVAIYIYNSSPILSIDIIALERATLQRNGYLDNPLCLTWNALTIVNQWRVLTGLMVKLNIDKETWKFLAFNQYPFSLLKKITLEIFFSISNYTLVSD